MKIMLDVRMIRAGAGDDPFGGFRPHFSAISAEDWRLNDQAIRSMREG
jgi:hypothetical protein